MGKVCVLTTSYPETPGDPSGHFVRSEAMQLAATGERVSVFAPGERSRRDGPLFVRGLPSGSCFGWPGALPRLRERPWRAGGAARFMVAARRALRADGPFERVIAHFIVPCAWPVACGAPSLEVICHGSDVRLLCSLPGRTRIVHALLSSGARFRFTSERLRDQLCRATTPRLHDVSSVDLPPLSLPTVPARGTARRTLAIDETVDLTVIVGRLVPSKRVHRALEFALRAGGVVVVVGDGPELAALHRRFAEAHFVGRLSRTRTLTWIAAADRLVSASLLEGAPTAIREARALGIPVVCAGAGDLRRWAESDPGLVISRELDESGA